MAAFDTQNILGALQVVHEPRTKEDERRRALEYLEQVKSSSPDQGFVLAKNQAEQPIVRHFGLSILDHIIRHRLHELDHSQCDNLRKQIIELGLSINDNEPVYLRNKIAELWIELAKRSWALDWFDLDSLLCALWYKENVQKDFALNVLENLSDDTFVREDTTAVLRGKDLNSALLEIYVTPSDYPGGLKVGNEKQKVRSGSEGWLSRISQFLDAYSTESASAESKATGLRALATLRSALGWVMSGAIISARCLFAVCGCLMKQDEELITAALDCLLALYSRQNFDKSEVYSLVSPLCGPDSVAVLQQVYTWSIVDVDEIDTGKYTVSKKISELLSLLSDNLTSTSAATELSFDVSPFLQLTINVAKHQSLIVSIPAVHSWAKLLQKPEWRRTPAITSFVPALLDVVCSRMVQYDQLQDVAPEHPEVRFVLEEIDIHHERSGFFANYRRLCQTVIDWISYTHLEQALEYIFLQVTKSLSDLKTDDASLNPTTYQRPSLTFLRADAQFSIVEAAFKGFERWQTAHADHGGVEGQALGQRVRESVKLWATNLHSSSQYKDPQIKQRLIKTMVETSSRALQKDTSFAYTVLQHILGGFVPIQSEYPAYTDAVMELHSYSIGELRRLATYHANYFATLYDQLTQTFTELVRKIHVDPKIQIELRSVLFLIVQRADSHDSDQQQQRLWSFLQPLQDAWNSTPVRETVQSFESYTKLQAFDTIGPFMTSIHAQSVDDWTVVQKNNPAAEIQQHMSDAFFSLPLRETRVLLSLSTENLEPDSSSYKMISELWMKFIGTMLESVLRLTNYNHRLHDPTSWPGVTADQVPILRRILRDRYWQSGISQVSMHEFHMKVRTSKASLEGFASSVRARIRTNLEQCYSIIHTLGKLGGEFYSLENLPSMIAEALIASSANLSPHHFSIMLAMMPKLIEECPPQYRQQFLTPIMTELLLQMDTKLTTEWEKIGKKKAENHENEDLNDEMRDDSVLRQTTVKAVNIVAFWIDSRREEQLSTKKTITNFPNGHSNESFRDFVLSNRSIVERLLIFLTHAIGYKDGKACYTMTLATIRIVPCFALPEAEYAPIREYISKDMLQAALLCINDGYFAGYQQNYAQLIATIWLLYGLPTPGVINTQGGLPGVTPAPEMRPALSSTPRDVLRSLAGISETRIDAAADALVKEGINGKVKRLRAIILALLEGVRGVRVSELGKIDTRLQQSRILELYKQRESSGMDVEETRAKKDNVDYGGIAEILS